MADHDLRQELINRGLLRPGEPRNTVPGIHPTRSAATFLIGPRNWTREIDAKDLNLSATGYFMSLQRRRPRK